MSKHKLLLGLPAKRESYRYSIIMKEETTTSIDSESLETSVLLLRAVTHPLRMKILKFIHENKKVNVNKIFAGLNIEQSIASQHLKILRAEDLVFTTKKGTFIFYTINYDKLGAVIGSVQSFLE